MKIKAKINGYVFKGEVEDGLTLLEFLRDKLKITSPKRACAEGECGCCAVIMDGKIVNSCLVMAVQANNSEIITVEGLINQPEFKKLQNAFIKFGTVQCGFCIPGFVISVFHYIKNTKKTNLYEIKKNLVGNYCRCTGYKKILQAIRFATK